MKKNFNARPRHEKIYSYGKHALEEALNQAPGVVRKVFLSAELAKDEELRKLLRARGIIPEILKSREADRMVGDETAHQGAIAVIDPEALVVDFRDFVRKNFEKSMPDEKTLLVLLDELTDPHNVGAIIRSAVAFGAAGVLLPSHNQAGITGAVVKSSAGMVFRIPIIAIGNVNQTVDELKELGFRTYGLAMGGSQELREEQFKAPTLVIVGNEGKGIREKTLARCDVTLRIPMDARAESLNASVSAAIVLYQWSVRHLGKNDEANGAEHASGNSSQSKHNAIDKMIDMR